MRDVLRIWADYLKDNNLEYNPTVVAVIEDDEITIIDNGKLN